MEKYIEMFPAFEGTREQRLLVVIKAIVLHTHIRAYCALLYKGGQGLYKQPMSVVIFTNQDVLYLETS